jgi:fermentation-respiration switch protein FrsA (DUF1100 family)
MKRYLCATIWALALGSSAQAAPPAPPSPVGTWSGTLDVGVFKLRVVFHVATSASGLTATMDSPDQGAYGLPVDQVEYQAPTLRIEASQRGLRYEGKLEGARLTGTFTQGKDFPLVLDRISESAVQTRARPQLPKRPFPYREEEVHVTVPEHYGTTRENVLVKLAGTLSLPPGKGPFPAVLFITGSGPEDRDETIFDHKPFLVLSDVLVRAGIATLRFDDRGTGQSGSSQKGLTTLDLAEDTRAELAYLSSRPEVDKRAIGLLGHSEGGVIAPIIAATSAVPRFLVLLAGTGMPGREILRTQQAAIMRGAGQSEADITHARKINDQIFAIVEREPDAQKVEAAMRVALQDDPNALKASLASLPPAALPWMRTFLTLDPVPYLKQVKVPVLALNGERDLQVDVTNLALIERALKDAGNKDVSVRRLPELNHLFQHAKTGVPSEYVSIEETISPEVLGLVRDFVLAHAR